MAWDSIIEARGDQLKVNLLLNRASQWADLESCIPYEGKVTLNVKKSMRNVAVRIPKWVDRSQVSLAVNGKSAEYRWTGEGCIDVGNAQGR